jgi:hypothetical protein
VSFGNIDHFQSPYSLASLVVPKMNLLLGPGNVVVVILVLNEVLDVSLMALVAREFFDSELKRLFVETDVLSVLSHELPLFVCDLFFRPRLIGTFLGDSVVGYDAYVSLIHSVNSIINKFISFISFYKINLF